MLYKIYFTTFGYYSSHEFDDLNALKKYVKSTSFQCKIEEFDGKEYKVILTYMPGFGFSKW